MTEDEKFKIWQDGFNARGEHSKPSPQTLKELEAIKTSMDNFKTHLEYIKEKLDKNDEAHRDIADKIDLWIKESENRFAPKWVADVLKWLIAIISGSVVVALVKLVIIK